jgi:hypothetical protein
MRKIISYFLVLTSTVLMLACASKANNYSDNDSWTSMGKAITLGYDGPIREIKDVGIITKDRILSINAINGTPIEKFKSLEKRSILGSASHQQIHLPPGEYTLSVGFSYDAAGTRVYSKSDINVSVKLVAGQIIHLQHAEQRRTWSVEQFNGSAALKEIERDFSELRK